MRNLRSVAWVALCVLTFTVSCSVLCLSVLTFTVSCSCDLSHASPVSLTTPMLQLPKMLMLEMMGFKRQMLGFSAEQAGAPPATDLPPAKTDDGVAITDKKHCLDPNVWVDGQCKGDPRGRKSTERDRKAACGGGENTPSCKSFTENLVRSRKKCGSHWQARPMAHCLCISHRFTEQHS